MNKKIIYIGSLAVCFLTACKPDKQVYSDENRIKIFSQSEQIQNTKASTITGEFQNGDKICVFAVKNPLKNQIAGFPATQANYFWWNTAATFDATVNPPSGMFRYTPPGANLDFYPSNSYLDFYAAYPTTVVNPNCSIIFSPNAPPRMRIDQKRDSDVWGSPGWYRKDHNKPIDYMYAVDGEKMGSTPIFGKKNQPIQLKFKHAFCQVEFIFKRTGTDINTPIYIKEIQINPTYVGGTISLQNGSIDFEGLNNQFITNDNIVLYSNVATANQKIEKNTTLPLPNLFLLCPSAPIYMPTIDKMWVIADNAANGRSGTRREVYFESRIQMQAGHKYTFTVEVNAKRFIVPVNGIKISTDWVTIPSQQITY